MAPIMHVDPTTTASTRGRCQLGSAEVPLGKKAHCAHVGELSAAMRCKSSDREINAESKLSSLCPLNQRAKAVVHGYDLRFSA